jgi:hypothetical protein
MPLGSARSAARSAFEDSIPMRFMTDIASTARQPVLSKSISRLGSYSNGQANNVPV